MLCGIDIGGTKLGVCLGQADGSVIASEVVPTSEITSPADALNACLDRLDALSANTGGTPTALGVACPGPFDRRERRFLDTPNMPAWQGFELGLWLDRVVAERGLPAHSMNDANAAAYAEWLWGSQRGADVLVFLTMSTGFGAGIVVDGRPIEGPRGFAGEVGRIRLAEEGPVGFGAFGTVEGFCSGRGIAQQACAERLRCAQSGEATRLLDVEPGALDSRMLCELAHAGDPAARRVTDRVADRVGQLIAIVANVLEPEAVVIGTIAAAYPELFITRATEVAERDTVRSTFDPMRIVASTLSDRWQRQALAAALLADTDGASRR